MIGAARAGFRARRRDADADGEICWVPVERVQPDGTAAVYDVVTGDRRALLHGGGRGGAQLRQRGDPHGPHAGGHHAGRADAGRDQAQPAPHRPGPHGQQAGGRDPVHHQLWDRPQEQRGRRARGPSAVPGPCVVRHPQHGRLPRHAAGQGAAPAGHGGERQPLRGRVRGRERRRVGGRALREPRAGAHHRVRLPGAGPGAGVGPARAGEGGAAGPGAARWATTTGS